MVIRILIYYYSLLILLSENVPIKQICPEDIYIMIKFGKLKYLFFIFLIFCSSCANIYREEIKREPEKKDVYRKPADEKIYRNSVIVKATEQEAWDATLYSIGWIKWKIFKEDYQNGTITLKEAYVYDDNNSFKRIYHWPPKEKALLSNMTDYLTHKLPTKRSAPFIGRVAKDWNFSDLHSDMKWNAGLGIRAWAQGIVVRIDTAYSNEGVGVQMMISQPFQF